LSDSAGLKRLSLRQGDKVTLYLSIAGIVALSWWYLIDMAAGMPEMSMSGSTMVSSTASMDMPSPTGLQNWTPQTFWMIFAMWAVMMVGMMLPSAVRTIMIYARVAQQANSAILPATFCFISGYLIVWTAFSLAATGAQWWLNQHALLSPMMVSTSDLLGAGLLITAGIYQLTPFKEACLKHCQSPVTFISRNFKKGYPGAAKMGVHHGLFCLGCCWMLMGLLFIAGVMNLLWILVITLYVMCEKLLPSNRYTAKFSGILMILTSLILFPYAWF